MNTYIERENYELAAKIDSALRLLSPTEHEAALKAMRRAGVPIAIISRLIFADQMRRQRGDNARTQYFNE